MGLHRYETTSRRCRKVWWRCHHEDPPPTISEPGRRRCCALGRLAHRKGANLPVSTSPLDCRVSPWWDWRHLGASDGSMALGAVSPAIHNRKPTGRWLQYRHRGGREGTPRWLYASASCHRECDWRRTLPKSQFQFHPGHRPGHRHHAGTRCGGGTSIGPGDNHSRVHRLRQSQSAQDQHGVGRQRHCATHLRRTVQDDGRRRLGPRAISGRGPSMTDLLGGQVQVIFSVVTESIEHIRANKLRPLAVTTATRWEGLPDVPTVGDFMPGYEGSGWQGVGVPKNTPAEIIDKLNREINAGLADPKIKARLAELGGTILAGSPADFAR